MKKTSFRSTGYALPVSNFSCCRIFHFKKLLIRFFLLAAFAMPYAGAFSQDSSHIRIALLTCTPGEELYSTFGHTAIRVTDSSSVTDYVFNYGTFRFDDPAFYTKFIRGKLLYYLSADRFADFRDEYKEQNRGITEQVLNLDAATKIAMMEALYDNAKEANRYYKYDFFLDNCTTRARDILIKYRKDIPTFNPVMPEGTRFRQAIHQYLDLNEKYWSKLGIDLLLGAPTDAIMTTAQSQFLPDNLMKSFDSSNQNHQLVLSTTNLYNLQAQNNKGSVFTPMFVFSFLLLIVALLSFSPNKRVKNFLQGFEATFFFITGLLGILLILMWIGTDHSMTKDNYNLLWAWPTNAVIAFYMNGKKKWLKKYFSFHMAGLIIVLLSWFFLPQQLNTALIPLVLLLIFISFRRYSSQQA